MSKITVEGIEELLGLVPHKPPAPPKNASPPLVNPQNQNPMPAPSQTGVPSVARPPAPPIQVPQTPSHLPVPMPPPGNDVPGSSEWRHNQHTQEVRNQGKVARQGVQTGALVPATPPPPPGQPVQYQPPNKALEYIGTALSLLFGGSRMGAAGAGLVQGLGERSENQYNRALQQRQSQIDASTQGYDFNTGQRLPTDQLTAKQMYIPPNATAADIEGHYLRVANILLARGDIAGAKQATEMAGTAATGFRNIAEGTYTGGARTQEAVARAHEYEGANATKLAALTQEEAAKVQREGLRLANQVKLAGINNASRNAIALRAAIYHLHGTEEGLAMRQSIAEFQEGGKNYRAGDSDTMPGFDDGSGAGTGGATVNIFNDGTPHPGGTTPPSGHGAIVKTGTANGKHVTQYQDGATLFDDGTPVP